MVKQIDNHVHELLLPKAEQDLTCEVRAVNSSNDGDHSLSLKDDARAEVLSFSTAEAAREPPGSTSNIRGKQKEGEMLANIGPLSQAFGEDIDLLAQCRFVLINLAEVFSKFTGTTGIEVSGDTMAEEMRVQMARAVADSNECSSLDARILKAEDDEVIAAIEKMELWAMEHPSYSADEASAVAYFESSLEACATWLQGNVQRRDEGVSALQSELREIELKVDAIRVESKEIVVKYRHANASGLKEVASQLHEELRSTKGKSEMLNEKSATLNAAVQEKQKLKVSDYFDVFGQIDHDTTMREECKRFINSKITAWGASYAGTVAHQS